MRALRRSGFTLIELALGLVMLAVFASAMVAVVRGAGLSASRATASLLADRAMQSLQQFLQQELRDASSTDVTVMSATRMAVSRPIGEERPCADSGGKLLLADSSWTGSRLPAGGRDDAWLLIDPVAATWLRLAIDSVTSDRCPADNALAMRLHLPVHAGRAAIVRVMEPVHLSAYRSGAADWFGLAPANGSAAVQPFAGPLTPGIARFSWFADHLAIVVPPLGLSPVIALIPLGP